MLKIFSKKFIIIYVFFAFLMLYRLGTSMFTADSHFWYLRTQNFISAVKEKSWENTYQNPKPGVTIMWASGIAMDAYLNYYESKHDFVPYIFSSDIFPRLDFVAKFPLVVLCLISVLCLYLLIKKVLNEDMAFFSVVFLVFQPYYIGVSRFFHGDGTLTVFMTISVCFLLYYVIKEKKNIFLILCGIAGGLAFLTKMQAIYLIPYTYLILSIDSYVNRKNLSSFLTNLAKNLSLWSLVFVLTVFILFPALWVEPTQTLTNMYKEATRVTGNLVDTDPDNLYIGNLVKIFNPLSIIFFITGVFFFALKVKEDIKRKNLFLIYVFLFLFFYLIQMQLIDKKSSRYLLPLFPFASIFCAYGFLNINNRIKNRLLKLLLSLTLLGYLIVNISTYIPHYTAMTEGHPWGALSYEAANYLNKKSKAHLLNVVVITKEQTFRPFFKGTTYAKGETLPEGKEISYVVVSTYENIPDNLKYCIYEYTVTFKNKEFWKIYNCVNRE